MSYIIEHKKTILLIILILGLMLFYTLSTVRKAQILKLETNPMHQSLKVSDDQTSYTDLAGDTTDLSKYFGEYLVVNSWASWSPDSARELSLLSEVVSEYQGFKVLAINRGEPANTAERFLKSTGATTNVELILDSEDRYYKSIAGFAMPETVFYDRSGKIIFHHRGALSKVQLKSYLDRAIKVVEDN